jgi:hypothetical protein
MMKPVCVMINPDFSRFSPLNPVALKTHQGHEQGGFARPVLAEQNMGFSFGDMQIYSLENLLAVDAHLQVVNIQHVHATTTIKKALKAALRASENLL